MYELSPIGIATLLQVILGAVLLLGLVVRQVRAGGPRSLLAVGPPRRNRLTGGHLILVLAAAFAGAAAFSAGMEALRGEMPPPPVAPATSQPLAPEPPEASPPVDQTDGVDPPAAAAAHPVTGPPFSKAEQLGNLASMALMEVMMIAVILWLAGRTFAGGLRGFGLDTRRVGRDIMWATVAYLAFFPVAMLVAEGTMWIAKWLRPEWQPVEHAVVLLLKAEDLPAFWRCLLWLVAGVLAPVFEELLFRGLLQSWFRSASGTAWLAICTCGLLFGAIHAQQWQNVPALMALGIALGYAYERSGSLTLAIVFHCLFNLRTLLVLALAGSAG